MSKYEKYTSWKKFKTHLLTKLYLEWVENEFDLELLAMTKSMITARETELKTFIDKMNHVEIKGYRR